MTHYRIHKICMFGICDGQSQAYFKPEDTVKMEPGWGPVTVLLLSSEQGPWPDSQNCCAMWDGCIGKHQKSPFFLTELIPADEWCGLSLPSLMPAARRLLTVPTAFVSHLYKTLQSSQNCAQYTHHIYPSQACFLVQWYANKVSWPVDRIPRYCMNASPINYKTRGL